jgi:hypothetical protein
MASNWAANNITRPIPNLFKQIDRLFEDRSFKADHFYGDVMRNIPVVNSLAAAGGILKPRLNALGEEIHLGNTSTTLAIAKGTASFFTEVAGYTADPMNPNHGWLYTVSNQDPAWEKIQRLGLKIPTTSATGNKMFGLPMTDAEVYDLTKLRGSLMRSLVNNTKFEEYTPAFRQKLIEKYNNAYTKHIKTYILNKRMTGKYE